MNLLGLTDNLFFPHACDVCKSTDNVSKCSGCKLVSYCGRDHQSQQWPIHKSFCRGLSQILKEEKESYIYKYFSGNEEGLEYSMQKLENMRKELQSKLNRPPSKKEMLVLIHQDSCFKCNENKPEKLKICSTCGVISFCELHLNAESHTKQCFHFKKIRELKGILFKLNMDIKILILHIKLIAEKTEILRSGLDLPTSLTDFYDKFTQIEISISKEELNFLSRFFRISLTISSILRAIYSSVPSNLIIHVNIHDQFTIAFAEYWESLLHLLPDIKSLKIVIVAFDKNLCLPLSDEILLCEKCRSSEKRFFLEINSDSYKEFMLEEDYQEPNFIAALYDGYPGLYENCQKHYEKIAAVWNKVKCPVALTIASESGLINAEKILETSSGMFEIIYEGRNDYSPFNSSQGSSDDDSQCEKNEYMLIFQQ